MFLSSISLLKAESECANFNTCVFNYCQNFLLLWRETLGYLFQVLALKPPSQCTHSALPSQYSADFAGSFIPSVSQSSHIYLVQKTLPAARRSVMFSGTDQYTSEGAAQEEDLVPPPPPPDPPSKRLKTSGTTSCRDAVVAMLICTPWSTPGDGSEVCACNCRWKCHCE